MDAVCDEADGCMQCVTKVMDAVCDDWVHTTHTSLSAPYQGHIRGFLTVIMLQHVPHKAPH